MCGTQNWEDKEKTTAGGTRGEQRFHSPHSAGETFGNLSNGIGDLQE